MTRIKRDPRASILDNRRLVADCLVAIFPGNGGDFGANAGDDRLSGTARADLAWMADMVKQIERGTNPTDKDAIAFASGTDRVLGALEAIESRSWSTRLDRLSVLAIRVAVVASGAGFLIAGAVFVAMFWIGPPSPAGYDTVMRGSFRFGLAGLSAMVAVVLIQRLVLALRGAMRWVRRHPFRAAIWLIGIPMIGGVTYLIGGLVGLACLGIAGVALALFECRSATGALETVDPVRRSFQLPDYHPGMSIHDPRVVETGAELNHPVDSGYSF